MLRNLLDVDSKNTTTTTIDDRSANVKDSLLEIKLRLQSLEVSALGLAASKERRTIVFYRIVTVMSRWVEITLPPSPLQPSNPIIITNVSYKDILILFIYLLFP